MTRRILVIIMVNRIVVNVTICTKKLTKEVRKSQTIGLSLRAKGREGEALPAVFHQLEDVGAKIRRGQVTLIAGAPASGKSAIATQIALFSDYTGHGDRVPTLYFSADSDKTTFGSRAAASALDIRLSEAEEAILNKDEEVLTELDALTDHMWVNFDCAPTPKDIDAEVDCFAYIYGEYPHLIVIDNLMDVSLYGMEERAGHDAIIDFARQLARRTSAAVLILCHVVGAYTDGLEPIPRSGLMNKIDKRPRLILTLHQPETNVLAVSVVKNSNGPAKSDGSMIVDIGWMPEKCFMSKGN